MAFPRSTLSPTTPALRWQAALALLTWALTTSAWPQASRNGGNANGNGMTAAPPAPPPLQLPALTPVQAAESPASAPAGLFSAQTPAEHRIWRADMTAGYTSVSGNAQSSAGSMRAEAIRQTVRHRLQIEGHYLGNRTPEAGTNRIGTFIARHQVDLRRSSFFFSQFDVLHDEAQHLSGRYGISTGLGQHMVATDAHTWDVSAGVGYTTDTYAQAVLIEDREVRHYARRLAVFSEESRHRWTPTTTLRQRLSVRQSLNDNATRSEFDTHLDLAMNSILSLSVGLNYRYDSKPTGDLKQADTSFVTGLKAHLY